MATIKHIEIEHDGERYSYNPATGQWLIRYEEHSGHYGWDRLKPVGADYFGRSLPEEVSGLVENVVTYKSNCNTEEKNMRDGLTEIVFVIDMSGSMGSIRDDAVGGFNNFVEEQKKLSGDASMTVVFFNGVSRRTWQENTPLKEMPVLGSEYSPSHNTPLLDAVGHTINQVGERLSATPEDQRPGAVMLVIVTDGQENASCEFTNQQIKDMIKHQEEAYAWTVTYLGANVDAFAEAAAMGISSDHTAGYVGTAKGIRSAYSAMNCSASATRDGSKIANLGRNIGENK